MSNRKKARKSLLSHIVNILTIALIVESFLCAMMAVRKYAREDCIDHIEEVAGQMTLMFNHAMDEQKDKLTVFADILAANFPNPDQLITTTMETFCRTQNFTATCIHRADGTSISYGSHPHELVSEMPSFEVEMQRVPYISDVYFYGSKSEQNYFYQAVPIMQNGRTIAILYGYVSLNTLPSFISSNMYDGKCQFYIVDGTTGNYIMDEYHDSLGHIDDMSHLETKRGYSYEKMKMDIQNGERGEFIHRSESTGEWYYSYYMPIGINHWFMQITVDEATAFHSYNETNRAMLILMALVIALMFIHVMVLMLQNARVRRLDKERLQTSAYINAVQSTLLNAHHNAGFVDRALRLVAEEMSAETAMLLSFEGRTIASAQYWPSTDKEQVMQMVGRNIRDDFPTFFDVIATGKSVIYDGTDKGIHLSESNRMIFESLDIRNVVLVPIMDPAGLLKGAIAAVNVPTAKQKVDPLECVTYGFFMAITNLENHNIIKKMGSMDYLTGIKNRNSYESEIGVYTRQDAKSLWCVFIDVDGLHDINNQYGHKMGDIMLTSVAEAIKRAFGDQHSYRIGGDEFVAFAADVSSVSMMKKKKAIIAELAVKGYHVSVGFAGIARNEDGLFDVERVVADAESIMYDEKRKFYEESGIPYERGHFPQKKKK